jgi:hypothetical protein
MAEETVRRGAPAPTKSTYTPIKAYAPPPPRAPAPPPTRAVTYQPPAPRPAPYRPPPVNQPPPPTRPASVQGGYDSIENQRASAGSWNSGTSVSRAAPTKTYPGGIGSQSALDKLGLGYLLDPNYQPEPTYSTYNPYVAYESGGGGYYPNYGGYYSGYGGYGGSGWVDYGNGGGWVDYGSGGGGGGGGGGTSGGGFRIGELTEPLTGYAKRYLPATIDEVAQNPGVVGRDVLGDMGIGEGPLANTMSRQMGFYGSQILPLLYGNMPIEKMPHYGDVVNRLAEFAQTQMTPGGAIVNPNEILQLVLTEAAKPATGPQTMMSALFGGQDASEQTQNMTGIINNLSNWTANPMFGQALRNWAGTQSEQYLQKALQANNPYTQGFAKHLQGTMLPR